MIRRLKSFWQRGTRGWADEDTHDLDAYLARVISESVWYLGVYGHPGRCYHQNTHGQQDPACGKCYCASHLFMDLLGMSMGFARWAEDGYNWDGGSAEEIDARYKLAKTELSEALTLFADNFIYLWD